MKFSSLVVVPVVELFHRLQRYNINQSYGQVWCVVVLNADCRLIEGARQVVVLVLLVLRSVESPFDFRFWSNVNSMYLRRALHQLLICLTLARYAKIVNAKEEKICTHNTDS
jgi:hypothetical protein